SSGTVPRAMVQNGQSAPPSELVRLPPAVVEHDPQRERYGRVVLVVGLTGGIGSGKSTVAAGLAARGADVIDADRVAREVMAPGGPAYQPVVDHFGAGIVRPDATIDRPALAAVVFGDPRALEELNQLTHPVIRSVIGERIAAVEDREVVVL